ncbi:Plasmodium exported protein (hyp13), unknown, putative [Plasmodium gaboni]|uniref:Exported protein (Hyp13) n=1 Tax=Plasmodium gaboni TaxID=647221 RepID=A0ABY1UIL8_9APIC|nr:Plasmodium exported protein (hyp13), unknown, putative [Plasmodium gaboni]
MSSSPKKICLNIIKYIFLLLLHQETLHKLNIKYNSQIIGTNVRKNRSLVKYEKLTSQNDKMYDTKLPKLIKKINKHKDDALLFNEILDDELKLYDIEINKFKGRNKAYTYENHYNNDEIESNYKKKFIHDKYIFYKNTIPFLKKNKIFCKRCMKKFSRSLNMFKTNFAFILSEANSPMSLRDSIIVESFISLLSFLSAIIICGIAIGISYLLRLIALNITTLNPATIPIFIILIFTIFVVVYLVKSKKKEKELMDR